MTSILFYLDPYIIVEYIFDSDTLPCSQYGLRKIHNNYTGLDTFVNSNNSKPKTKNVVDDTVQLLNDGRYVLLDNDSSYFYPNLDPNIQVSDLVIPSNPNIKYDKIRFHIVSGYNFNGLDGFVASIKLRMNNGKDLNLCQYAFLKYTNYQIYFNPKPLKISDFMYDKYVEISVPSASAIIDEQNILPNFSTTLSYYLTDGVYLADQDNIYLDFKYLNNREFGDNGETFFTPDQSKTITFLARDNFQQLSATIRKSSQGDYFEYFGSWDSNIIEDFIYRLNSISGNDYIIIHDISVIEQIGMSFVETFAYTDIQTKDFDEPREFIPILKRADVAVSFSLEYTCRLYNRADGKSIFKNSVVTYNDPKKFGKQKLTLNLGNVTKPVKIYNKIVSNDNLPDLSAEDTIVIQNVITAIEKHDISVSLDDKFQDQNFLSTNVEVSMFGFDNIYKFIVKKKDDKTDSFVDLSGSSSYFMNFKANDDVNLAISEYNIGSTNRVNGELSFFITSEQSKKILKFSNKSFYVTIKNSNSTETVLFNGTFKTI